MVGKVIGENIVVVSEAISLRGLVIGFSIVRWCINGQLLSNIPPILIETLLILITKHNFYDSNRNVNLLTCLIDESF